MDFSYLIIDSNAARSLQIRHFMEEYQELAYLEDARTTNEGLNAILKYKPDLVIMNLDQEAQTRFEMCRELPQYLDNAPLIIGVATSTDHAYQAVKHQFFDYWLYPYNEYDIRKTVLKLKKRLPKPEAAPTLLLQSYKDYQYLDTSEILYLQADNNTTDFIMRDGSRISAYKTLKTFENQLPDNFIRVHQSYILNRDYVSRIHYGKNRCFLKHIQTELPFSRGYRNNVDALKTLLTQRALHRD
ncbi:LytR/AlgR family response regulator transcription factor [Robiginitalea myxolifaciens]|uniref:LytR/AlgR family response regulator transcription factor n=1 Tax=Robiginitalea myxolifaciens TaxID=400055 RepID=UPI000B86F508|nr:LytTR family DNA-binding domain-containing protein [Robiginitalea myxolifaciens]